MLIYRYVRVSTLEQRQQTKWVIFGFALVVLFQILPTSGDSGFSYLFGASMLPFQPLREQLQRLVNRLLFGQRDEPYRVLSQLSKQLEATLRPDILLHTIIETTAKALKLLPLPLSRLQNLAMWCQYMHSMGL